MRVEFMQPYGTTSNVSVTEKYQPDKNLRFVAFIVFIIGALISIPTFMIGLEQEGSWLICQIGAIIFCLTVITTFVLEAMFVHNSDRSLHHFVWRRKTLNIEIKSDGCRKKF